VSLADEDGFFSYSAVFTYGREGGYFAADFIDCLPNVTSSYCFMTGDGFCLSHVEPGHTDTYNIEGTLSRTRLAGKITISHSTQCPDDPDPQDHTITTVILPHTYAESPSVLCLSDQRFAVVVDWLVLRDNVYHRGWAEAAPFSNG